MALALVLRMVLIVVLQGTCASLTYTYGGKLELSEYEYAKAAFPEHSQDFLDSYEDPCGAVDFVHPNVSSYEFGIYLHKQSEYQADLEAYQKSQGLVPYSLGYELTQKKSYKKHSRKYFRLAPRSPFPPVLQKTFLILRPQSFEKFLVNAHDFNKKFHDVLYVSDDVTIDTPNYMEYEVQICSPCNRHINRTYWSFSDFNGRYVSCDLGFMYPGKKVSPKPTHYGVCRNDEAYEKICNPCGRKKKIVNVPVFGADQPRIKLRLPYEEIVRLGVPFWDKYNNVYEFMSLEKYNLQFDNEYGNPLPKGFDTSQMYKYYYVKDNSHDEYK